MVRNQIKWFALAAILAVAGTASAASAATITSVAIDGLAAAPTFVIHGHGFGSSLPPAVESPITSAACRNEHAPGDQGGNYGSKLYFIDSTAKFSGGLSGPYEGVANVVDCVGLILTSYSSSRVVFTLGSDYRKHPYAVRVGDRITIVVNGAKATVTVKHAP
jgi:hypothetical protein